ncbi:hypothetical protein F2Q69_00060169 [Brassica cretica]|uniref:Uncharacterized protein n=1 Tax=Brassica cretica TaxID=69181 RepID=A0A8S9RAD5_BRACR|nr:hypothetical protein F2Q69_00060169 [Brassica cretica]
MHLKNSSVAERRFIGKEAAACLPSSSDSDPKPKIKHHRPLQVPETVEIADSSSPPQSSHPFDLRRGGGGSSRASLGSILSFLSSSLPSIPSATNQKLIRQVLRVRLICFHLRFLLLLSVPPLYVFFLLISFRFFLLFVFSILTFSFILSISLKLALPHLPSIGLIIARLLSLKLTPARSSFSSSSQVVWSIGSKPVTEKKTSSGSWVQKYSSGDVYEGEFHKGKCSGSGVYYYSMKGKYEGDWVDGKYDGYGVETWAKGSRYRERRFIGKEAAACLPSSDSDPKPKIKHHRPLQVPETVEIADSSSPPQSSHPFDLRRGGGGSSRASLGSILSFLSSSLPSIPSATNQKLIRQVLRVRLICFHLRFLLLLSVPPLYVFFLLISFRFFLLFVFSILTFSFILSISLKLALPHLPSIGLIIARLLSLKLTPARSSFSSSSQVVWSIGSKPVTEKKTSSGSWVQKYSSGDVYEGEFHKGKCSGSGVYYYSMKGKYEGDWVDGKYDGYGVETWAKGSRYRGQYRQGMRHGAGIYRFYTGDVYAGEWSNGQSHGCGVYTSEDGSRFVGEFKWGVKHGLGHYHFRESSPPAMTTFLHVLNKLSTNCCQFCPSNHLLFILR